MKKRLFSFINARFDTLRQAQCKLRQAQWSQLSASFGKLTERITSLSLSFKHAHRGAIVICLCSMLHVPCSVHAQIPSYVPTNGLVGWWPFNGNANDESVNGNNGTVNGATLTTDRFGVANKAYSFDGLNDFIDCGNGASLNQFSNEITVSVWVKAPQTVTTDKNILSKYGCNPGGWSLETSQSTFTSSFTGCGQGVANQNNLYSDSWTNVIGIRVANQWKIYINGLLVTSSNIYSNYNLNSGFNLMIGVQNDNLNPSTFWFGNLDDIAIYSRALTQQEITNLYTNSLPPPSITTSATPSLINCGESATLTASSTSAVQPCIKADLPATLQNGLVGYWPFCGNANDASGNNNNGTVNGATLTNDRFGNANSAYSFNGINNSISVNNSATLNIQNYNGISMSGWVKIVALGNQPHAMVNFHQGNNQNINYVFDYSGTGGFGGLEFTNYNVNSPAVYIPSSPGIIVDSWYFISVTSDFLTNISKLYVNGQLSGQSSNTLVKPISPVLNFGVHGTWGFWWLNGAMDDIAIYNRALSASEIQQLYTLSNVSYSWSTGETTPNISVTPSTTSSYTCTATNASGSATSSVTVNVADTLTWTGSYDTDWHKPCNWSPQFVPKCCNNVSVPFVSNQPIVSGIAAAEDLTIYTTNGAQLSVNNGANLQIADCPTPVTTTACPSLAVLTTTTVSSITQTTAVSGGVITYQGANAITARGVCWSTSQNPTLANSFTTNGTGTGTFTSNLIGLTAGETYYVRAYATNGSGTSYGNQVSFVTPSLAAQYPAGSVFCSSGPTAIVDVTNPTTGKIWMDRNLGASQAATSSTDANAYGDLYQWGRGNDGHQCRTSATTSTLSSSDQPGNGNFILAPNAPYDWRSPQNANLWQGVNGVNNPCPTGYRLPTDSELDAERASWSTQNGNGAFNSNLKLTLAGYRNRDVGTIFYDGSDFHYWSSTISGTLSGQLMLIGFNNSLVTTLGFRADGHTVRCIKDASAIPATIGALNCGSTSTAGTLASGTAANGVSASVPYTGGNGGSYAAQVISSTGVTGLTASLTSGIVANGSGSLSFAISGIPSTSGTASFALTIGGQSCSFTVSVQSALAAQYPAASVFCASGPTAIVDVTNPTTGKTWMDRNLGASQVATSSTDAAAYGDLYQWGRGNDGHQCRTSATTSTLNSSDQPGNGNFILAPNAPYDWRSPQNANLWQGVNGVNNPCPTGYRLPTEIELDAERASWTSQNYFGALSSALKLVVAGYRENGALVDAGVNGYYWSSTVNSSNSKSLIFYSFQALMYNDHRAVGLTIRCIKDASAIPTTIGALNCGSTTIIGTLASGTAASGVSASVPYTGGNGGSYALQTISSTGVTGLTATLNSGTLANGIGSLSFAISGTPSATGTASFALTIGGQSCSFTVSVQSALAGQYPAASVFCASGPTAIVDVTNPTTGKIWMDRNLGASQAATSSSDPNAYGDLYQWGRRSDGHQCRTSATTTTISNNDQPGNSNYIFVTLSPVDWRSPQNNNLWQGNNGINNPCPSGYRVPTSIEINSERLTWSSSNNVGAMNSALKLPMAGYRGNGSVDQGQVLGEGLMGGGLYWTSTVNGTTSNYLFFNGNPLFGGIANDSRGDGFSVRCIKN